MCDYRPETRAFSIQPELTPASDVVTTLVIGFYPEDGQPGDMAEFVIEWRRITNNDFGVRLGVFDDAWQALACMPEVIELLARLEAEAMDGWPEGQRRPSPTVTPERMAAELEALGYRNKSKANEEA